MRRSVDVLAQEARRDRLHHPAATVGQGLGEGGQFLDAGIGAGHRLAVGGPVDHGARGGEAEGSRRLAFAHQRRHGLDVLRRRRLVQRPALAHDIGAQGAVGGLGADVDGELTLAQSFQIFWKGLPFPLDAV